MRYDDGVKGRGGSVLRCSCNFLVASILRFMSGVLCLVCFLGVYDCCVVLVVVCMKSRCRLVLLVYAVGWRN